MEPFPSIEPVLSDRSISKTPTEDNQKNNEIHTRHSSGLKEEIDVNLKVTTKTKEKQRKSRKSLILNGVGKEEFQSLSNNCDNTVSSKSNSSGKLRNKKAKHNSQPAPIDQQKNPISSHSPHEYTERTAENDASSKVISLNPASDKTWRAKEDVEDEEFIQISNNEDSESGSVSVLPEDKNPWLNDLEMIGKSGGNENRAVKASGQWREKVNPLKQSNKKKQRKEDEGLSRETNTLVTMDFSANNHDSGETAFDWLMASSNVDQRKQRELIERAFAGDEDVSKDLEEDSSNE